MKLTLQCLEPFEIHQPTSGGKAGFGNNLTSTYQVRKDGIIVKQFRFLVHDVVSKSNAFRKALDFISANR